VRTVHAILANNFEVLKSLANRFTERNFWGDNISKLKDMDKLVKHSVQIGCMLRFRKMLHHAMNEVGAVLRTPHLACAIN